MEEKVELPTRMRRQVRTPDARRGRMRSADAGREERRTRTEEGADLARLNDFFGSVNHAHVSQTRVYIGLFG